MKRIHRFISFLVTAIMLFSSIPACSPNKGSLYITKGEFFSIFLSEMNYYPLNCSVEEMQNTMNYDIEAQTMVDWAVLTEEQAMGDLFKTVTKETVALACVNSIFFAETGNVSDIKDANACSDSQKIADAVASGIASLENGYFDAKQKMTYTQCMDMIEKAQSIEISGHYEEGGTLSYDFGENSATFSSEDLLEGEQIYTSGWEDEEEEDDENITLSAENAAGQVMNLSSSGKKASVTLLGSTGETFVVFIPKRVFEKVLNNPKLGDTIVYMGFTPGDAFQRLSNQTFAGVLKDIEELKGVIDPLRYDGGFAGPADLNGYYRCTLEKIDDETVMANTETKEISSKAKNFDYSLLQEKLDGFKISLDRIDGGVQLTVKKTFEMSEGTYGNWRDATMSPTITCTASVSNFQTDINDIKYLFKKTNGGEEKSLAKLTYDFASSVTLDLSGLRYVPDDNRNSHALNAVMRSRFTDGKGANSIKLAKINIPIGSTGISVELYLLLNIHFDGHISISMFQTNGFEIVKQGKSATFRPLKSNEKKSLDGSAKVVIGVEAEAALLFPIIKSAALVYSLSVDFEFTLSMSIYKESTGGGDKKISSLNQAQVNSFAKGDETISGFCIDGMLEAFLRGRFKQTTSISNRKSLLYSLVGKLGYNLNDLDWEVKLFTLSGHIEESGIVDKCTRGETTDEEDNEITEEEAEKKAKTDGRFVCSQTKVFLPYGTCTTVDILGSPVDMSSVRQKYVGGLMVKVNDPSIIRATYDEAHHYMMITALSAGSTEVEIYLKKSKVDPEEYRQAISVTVHEYEPA